MNHTESQELVAFAYLFGDYLRWNPRKAKEIFEYLALKGSPKGQAGLGFIHAAGVYTNSSQAKVKAGYLFKPNLGHIISPYGF